MTRSSKGRLTAAPSIAAARGVFRAATRVDWSQFEGMIAARGAIGVLIPLVAGIVLQQPPVSAFGAIGAVSVGLGSFQGTQRSRVAVMLAASFGMAAAMFLGSLAGFSSTLSILIATISAFAAGLLLALGPATSFASLQAVVAVLVAGGFPAGPREAATRASFVLAGGLAQTLLIIVWPVRRFFTERRAVASAFRSLASYAADIPAAQAIAPEPHTFATTGNVLMFQALLDEAERIRASLAALTTRHASIFAARAESASDLSTALAAALTEIASAVQDARPPVDDGTIWPALERCSHDLSTVALIDALMGQMRAAWRTAQTVSFDASIAQRTATVSPIGSLPPWGDTVTTLRANLTARSTTFHHALRMAVAVGGATAIYRLGGWSRGYWMPLTALLVLKPDFSDTFALGLARIAGTLVGASLATLIVDAWDPGHGSLAMLVFVMVYGCYALFRINYALFAVCLTSYVVFILMLGGVGGMSAATLRAEYTVAGGAIALIVYVLSPSWAGGDVRVVLARMVDAHRAYVDALLGGYEEPATVNLERLSRMRVSARLARFNAEATIARMLSEPSRTSAMSARTAASVLAALRRHALAALALHAGLEHGPRTRVEGLATFRSQVRESFESIAAAIRTGTPPAPLPALRRTQLDLPPDAAMRVGPETDLMVDALNTTAELLG